MRFIHDNIYSIFVAITVFAVSTSWFVAATPEPSKAFHSDQETWVLPQRSEQHTVQSIEVINARNLWDAPQVVAEAPKEPEWRVLGLVKNGEDSFIMLSFESKPVEILKVGDALPDGQKIVEIQKDRFFVMTPKKKKLAIGIYKQ